MAHTNRYYIIKSNDPDMKLISEVIVGLPSNQRYSVDKTLIVVKLYKEDHHQYEFLKKYKEYSHKEIIEELDNQKWLEDFVRLDVSSDD